MAAMSDSHAKCKAPQVNNYTCQYWVVLHFIVPHQIPSKRSHDSGAALFRTSLFTKCRRAHLSWLFEVPGEPCVMLRQCWLPVECICQCWWRQRSGRNYRLQSKSKQKYFSLDVAKCKAKCSRSSLSHLIPIWKRKTRAS